MWKGRDCQDRHRCIQSGGVRPATMASKATVLFALALVFFDQRGGCADQRKRINNWQTPKL